MCRKRKSSTPKVKIIMVIHKKLQYSLIMLALLFLIYYFGAAYLIRRNENFVMSEHFAQVSMVNNTGGGGNDQEIPVYYPVLSYGTNGMQNTSSSCPSTEPPTPAQAPAAPSPPAASIPYQSPTPAPFALPYSQILTPEPAATRQPYPKIVTATPAPHGLQPAPGPPAVQYHCDQPKYTICEVIPIPAVSLHAFRFFAKEGKNMVGEVVDTVEDVFKRSDTVVEPTLQTTLPELLSVPYFELKTFQQHFTYAPIKSNPNGLNIRTNKGCSFVMLARLSSAENSDYIFASLDPSGSTYTMSMEDYKYYLQIDKWMLFIKVWTQSDNNAGRSIHTFLNTIDEKDEIYVFQDQMPLTDASLDNLVICGVDAKVTTNSTALTTCDVAYLGIYDRALNAYERSLIQASCIDILIKQPDAITPPVAIADFDVLTMDITIMNDETFDFNRIRDLSGNNNLLYNNDNAKNVMGRWQTQPFPFLELTKNDKYHTESSTFLDLPSGYTLELLFCGIEFSADNHSIIFSYSTMETNASLPQMVANITATNSTEGNVFSVIFFTSREDKMGRLDSSIRIETGTWYHIIVTSESKIYINGVLDPDTRGHAVTRFPSTQGRYINIGDYNNPEVNSSSSDYGNTLRGRISLAKIFNGPMNSAQVEESYNKIKPYVTAKAEAVTGDGIPEVTGDGTPAVTGDGTPEVTGDGTPIADVATDD
jgi:hypothetical protein